MLADHRRQERFAEQGIVVADPILPEVLDATRAVVTPLLPVERSDLHFSTGSADHAYRRRLSAELGRVLTPSLARHLGPAQYVFGVVIAQRPGHGTGMGFHQDLTFVDEEAGRVAVAWVPLVDVDHESGTLAVIPGSHLVGPCLRGTPTFPSVFRDVPSGVLDEYFTSVEVAAGTVVFTDPRLAHRSTDNRSSRERLVAVLTFIARDASLVHHYRWPDGRIERFRVDADFYVTFDLHHPPSGYDTLGFVDPGFPAIDPGVAAQYFADHQLAPTP